MNCLGGCRKPASQLRVPTGYSGQTFQESDVSFTKEQQCMDSISILACVVETATTGVQSSKKLYELLDDVKNGPEEIYTISQHARALHAIMYSLEVALKDDDLQSLIEDDHELINAVENLQQPLRNCHRMLAQLMIKIAGRLKPQPDGNGFRFSSYDIKWAMFTKRDVKSILRRLEANTSALKTGVGAITTIVSILVKAQGKENVLREIKRLGGATDAGYALRRYLAESVIAPEDSASREPSLKPQRRLSASPSLHTLAEAPAKNLAKRQRQRDELHDAALTGDTIVIARLIAEGADIDAHGQNNTVALFIAMENSQEDAAMLLLEHGCDINVRYMAKNDRLHTKFADGRTPLIWAAAQGLDRVVRKLLQLGQDVNLQTTSGRYALQEAIYRNRVSTAKILLEESKPWLEMTDDENWTALHQCADQGVWEIAQMLIEKGIDLEARTSERNIWGWRKYIRATAVLVAIETPHTKMVEVLCEAGADLTVENADHEMPIHMAVRMGNLGMVKAILQQGVSANIYTIRMQTPLMVAIEHENIEIAEYLVNAFPASNDFVLDNEYGPREMVKEKARARGVNVAVRLAMQRLVLGSLVEEV